MYKTHEERIRIMEDTFLQQQKTISQLRTEVTKLKAIANLCNVDGCGCEHTGNSDMCFYHFNKVMDLL